MKILSWNLGLCNEWVRKILMAIYDNKSKSCIKIAKFLNDKNPEYIFLQEVYSDTIEDIVKLLNNNYPFYVFCDKSGLAIFSKKEIKIQYKDIFNNMSLSNYVTNTYNGFLTVLIPDIKKIFINVHLSCSFCNNSSQILKIKNYCDKFLDKDYEIIILGDFNIDIINFPLINDIFEFSNTPNNNCTYHHVIKSCLDYGFKINNSENLILIPRVFERYESDHYPIMINL
jgi:exonuclease III